MTKTENTFMVRTSNEAWMRVFCAALTGVLAGRKGDDRDAEAVDFVMLAARVADEAMGVGR